MPTGASPAQFVRPAVAADRDAVLAFCANTFDWGDYIHEVWEHWLTDPSGVMLVTEADGRPVAVGRASIVAPGEAWLEGLRVHPDYRRRGIADLMNRAGQDWARAHGASVARLASWLGNAPPQRQVERLGFRPVAEFDYWVADAGDAGATTARAAPAARAATAADAEHLRAVWQHSDLRRAGDGLWAVGWAWRTMTAADVDRHVAAGTALVAGGGFALCHDSADGVRACWLDGPPDTWPGLLAAARSRAAASGLAHASLMAPRHPDVAPGCIAAGFTLDTAFRVYAIDL